MAATADAPDDTGGVDPSSVFYDTWLDYLVVALLTIEGLLGAWLGWALTNGVDQTVADDFAAEFFSDPEVSTAEFPFTEAEFADAVYAAFTWAGWGFVLTGVATVAVAVLFYRYRGSVRERLADGRQAPRWHAPLFGGLLATALVFVPFAQVLGGGVAGYLSDRSAIADGALAGVVFGAPAYLLWAAVFVGGISAGFGSIGLLVVFSVLIYLATHVFLATVGGLVGGFLS
ncbi:DUF5518 domain-containing protein [Halobacterium jilantaiense]|uniref:Yip1 domain-containing protein n=1 Tax=Halobacterium jilantaiense TaxID=355548 RepID=A0A1I0PQ91_9EURY|nr:DUF5518 domain-containing protein [Halobacterium jilantaiense]SEW16435.1 hypothetical protein SAMN04487945_1856 [Halobacterium jilantaiense]